MPVQFAPVDKLFAQQAVTGKAVEKVVAAPAANLEAIGGSTPSCRSRDSS